MRDLLQRPDLFSINTATLGYKTPLPAIIDACAARGIGAIAPWRRELQGEDLQQIAHQLAASNMSVSGLCRSTYYTAPTLAERKLAIDDNRRALDDAAVLNAACYMQVVGGLPTGTKDLYEAREQVKQGIRQLLPHSKDVGVPIALEPLHPMTAADRSCLCTLRQALDWCDELDPDGEFGLGVAVDVYHVWWDPDLASQILRAGKRILAFHVSDWLVPTTDLVTNPMDYLNPAHPLLLISFGRSGNSPESVAAVELANQFVPECYHLPITCNEAGALYQNAINSDNAFALLMPAETHDRGFAMTSSITTMMASCLAVFAPETINSQTFRDVADRCQAILTSLGDFSEGVFGYAPWKRIVYLGSGGLQGAARESALKVLELTAGKLAAFYDSPTGFRHGPKSLVDDETLVVVFVSSHPYTRQYDLDLLAELRRDNQAMRVIAIAAESSDIVAAGPHIILPPSRHFIDVEQAFCFLMYAQTFALMQSLHMGNTPDTPSASGTVNRVVQGVIIHPWQA